MDILEEFKRLRFLPEHHLGLGDIRITMGQQEDIAQEIERLRAERDALKAALRGMLDQFGFHRVHTGMVHDERQAILNAIDAIDAARRE